MVPLTRTTSPNTLIVDDGGSDGRRFWLLGLEATATGRTHTEEILLELGYDWDAITALKDAAAIL
jgi:hypothetical protein